MQEIRCPKCGEVFQVDPTGYAEIARQVRDKEFAKELDRREQEANKLRESELKMQHAQDARVRDAALAKQAAVLGEKEREIDALKAQLKQAQTAQALAVKEAVEAKTAEFTKAEQAHAKDLARQAAEVAARDRDIAALKGELKQAEMAQKLAVKEAVGVKETELSRKEMELVSLNGRLKEQETEFLRKEAALKEQMAHTLEEKDDLIAYYKDFKARQSTKMIGESLEQHCLAEFTKVRSVAFPNAVFEKDNDARTGSKGDFIYREFGPDGATELLSIMFEMKNEADTTATKHRNEDFFKELDKDRNEKKCEYAILVSLLEIDSEVYNNGIVDVSHRYPKMFVIRPQFFVPIIALLRGAAQKALSSRQELAALKNQQLDLRHFEENMNAFKEGFARNYRLASEKFKTAIDEINKTIAHLQKTRDALLSSENQLRLANNKADDLSIKRLTKNAPAVKAMFDALDED